MLKIEVAKLEGGQIRVRGRAHNEQKMWYRPVLK